MIKTIYLNGEEHQIDYESLLNLPNLKQNEDGTLSFKTPNGVVNVVVGPFASLEDGKVSKSQLPSYVDDVEEYNNFESFPLEGEKGKIYVDTFKNITYRWSGSGYIQIGGQDTAELEIAIKNLQDNQFSGDYEALKNKPFIPTKTSDLTNDSLFATTNQLFSGNYEDLSNKPLIPNDNNQLANGAGYITISALDGYAKTGDIDSLQASINNKANQSTIDTLQISVNNKAEQSSVDSLAASVNNKAEQSSVDSLSGSVTTNTNNISDLQKSVTSINGSIINLEEKDTSLQSQIDDLRNGITGGEGGEGGEGGSTDINLNNYVKKDDVLNKNAILSFSKATTIADISGKTIDVSLPEYSITATSNVGGIKSGQKVSGSLKDILDKILGSPTTFSISSLTDSNSSSKEYGSSFTLKSVTCNVSKGTASTLDKIEIRQGTTSGTLLGTLSSVVNGSNTVTLSSNKTYTSPTNIYAVLTYNTNETLSANASYSFFYYNYYGAVSASTSLTNAVIIGLNKSKNSSNLPITLSNNCAVIAVQGTKSTVKDENGYNVTSSFEKTTMEITNSLGAKASYTVFKLITPATASGKSYTVS